MQLLNTCAYYQMPGASEPWSLVKRVIPGQKDLGWKLEKLLSESALGSRNYGFLKERVREILEHIPLLAPCRFCLLSSLG